MGVQRYSHAVRVGVTAAESTEWVSDTCLTTLPAASVGHTLRTMVTASRSAGSLTEAFSFDAPVYTRNPKVYES